MCEPHRLVVDPEAVPGPRREAVLATGSRDVDVDRQPLREQLVHDLVARRQVRDRRGDVRMGEVDRLVAASGELLGRLRDGA